MSPIPLNRALGHRCGVTMTAETTNNLDSTDEIARCAYELWEREGRPDGRATEHWLQAEMMVRSAASGRGSESAAPSRSRRSSTTKGTGARREKKFEMVS